MKDSLKKLGDDYGLTPEGVRHAIEAYQDIICKITGGRLSKLTYDADYVLKETEEYYKQKYTNILCIIECQEADNQKGDKI